MIPFNEVLFRETRCNEHSTRNDSYNDEDTLLKGMHGFFSLSMKKK